MSSQLLEAALNFAELGFPVFPCAPGQKRPLPGSQGVLEATTDTDQIDRWWTAWPDANIGLSTAGLLVIDLDVDDIGAPNSWLQSEPDKLVELSAAPLSLTPRGGRHYIFKQPAGQVFRNTAGKLAPKVDTRADGGYILCPPSIVNGTAYRWAESAIDVSPDKLPEPPAWLLELLADNGDRGNSTRLGQAAPSNAIPSGQRNGALTSLGGMMRRAGMSQAEILAALLKANDDRCCPPMPTSEVETIAWSVARYEPDGIATAVAEDHYGQDAEEPVDSDSADPGQLPAHLLAVPGMIGDVMRYTLETAPYPDPVLAFAGAVVLQGFLASRKVRDRQGNPPCVYVLAVANTGSGKDAPRKTNQAILFEVGLTDCLGDSFASGEGLEDAFLTNAAQLFQVDECDSMLNAMKEGKDARYAGIMATLLKLFTSANGIYTTRAKAGQESRRHIDQPAMSLFGTALPGNVYGAFSFKMLTNGLFSRLLILEAGNRVAGADAESKPVPQSILDVARLWTEFMPGDGRNNLAVEHPKPKIVEQTAEAAAYIAEHRARMDAEYSAAQFRQDEIGMGMLSRANEKARRLALNYACSVNHVEPLIDLAAAKWACELVDYLTAKMLYMADRHASENSFEEKCQAMLGVLRKWRSKEGEAWMPFWKIGRALRGWKASDFEEVRKALLPQRRIEYESVATAGRPAEVYRLAV